MLALGLALHCVWPLTATALTLGEALNATNLVWKTGGWSPWLPEATWTYDGMAAAQSGRITASYAGVMESWIETVVSGPGTLTFAWSVSSEYGADFLKFYVDGVAITNISGSVGWRTQTFSIVGSGFHTLRWVYSKNEYGNAGSDAGWLDQVSFSSAKAQQFITFGPANCVVGVSPFALPATASSGLPVTFTQLSGPPLLAGGVLNPTNTGTLVVFASQAGNATYAAAPPVTNKIVVVGSNLVDVTPLGMYPKFACVGYGNGRFLAVGDQHWQEWTSPLSVFSSPDGLNWTAIEAGPTNTTVENLVDEPRRLLFTGSEFIVVGHMSPVDVGGGRYSAICRSVDGQLWSSVWVTGSTVTEPCTWWFSTSKSTDIYEAAYGNGVLITAAKVYTPGYPDSWSAVWGLHQYTMPDMQFSALRCPYLNDYRRMGGLGFVGGTFLYIYDGHGYRTTDGTGPVDCGLFPRLKTTDGSYPVRFAYGMEKFIAVGQLTNAPRGAVLISSNGITWGPDPPSFLTAGPLTDVAFLGDRFIALGDSDLLKSDDGGLTWGAFAGGSAGRGVAYNEGVYVVTQPNGTIQACYQPVPPGPPRILPDSLRFKNGQFSFTLQSTSWLRFEIQGSTNLVDWEPLARLTNATGTDSSASSKRRFYRAWQFP